MVQPFPPQMLKKFWTNMEYLLLLNSFLTHFFSFLIGLKQVVFSMSFQCSYISCVLSRSGKYFSIQWYRKTVSLWIFWSFNLFKIYLDIQGYSNIVSLDTSLVLYPSVSLQQTFYTFRGSSTDSEDIQENI